MSGMRFQKQSGGSGAGEYRKTLPRQQGFLMLYVVLGTLMDTLSGRMQGTTSTRSGLKY